MQTLQCFDRAGFRIQHALHMSGAVPLSWRSRSVGELHARYPTGRAENGVVSGGEQKRVVRVSFVPYRKPCLLCCMLGTLGREQKTGWLGSRLLNIVSQIYVTACTLRESRKWVVRVSFAQYLKPGLLYCMLSTYEYEKTWLEACLPLNSVKTTRAMWNR